MEILLVLAVGTLNIVCLLLGVKVGMSVVKGEPIELPSINPMKAYREFENNKQAEREQEELDTIMQNIETYDGTSRGQKEVSR